MNTINVEAIAAAEDFAKKVLSLPIEAQGELWKTLPGLGFTDEEIQGLQKYVALFHMFTDNRYYKAIQTAVGEMLWKTFNS